jgi:hypothetical protein
MKKIILAAALVASATSVFAADVGVSITVGQPGFYGHIDIGDFPRPRLIYAEPRIIIRGGPGGPPMYLHVPPGHAKNWSKHCSRYNACGRPVYFVQESWYNDVYVPRYREREHSRGDHRDDPQSGPGLPRRQAGQGVTRKRQGERKRQKPRWWQRRRQGLTRPKVVETGKSSRMIRDDFLFLS